MIELRDRQWLVDGRARILINGEVHYFRLARADWRDRLLDLTRAGADAVAGSLPWVVHELPDGTIDITGATADGRDIGAFCDRRDGGVLVREPASGLPAAVEVAAGEGRAIVLGCDYPADLAVYAALLGRLRVRPRWRTDAHFAWVWGPATVPKPARSRVVGGG